MSNPIEPSFIPHQETYYILNYDVLCRLLIDTFGEGVIDPRFDTVRIGEPWNNGTEHAVYVTIEYPHYTRETKKRVLAWAQGGTWPSIEEVLQELVHRNIIPGGLYLIHASW